MQKLPLAVFFVLMFLSATAAAPAPAKAGGAMVFAHNLLLDAKVSGNLESFGKGLRGRADHMIYDTRARRFAEESQWHEYGVGMNANLGVVQEEKPAYWLARWPEPVQANFIAFSGVYPNQPQPRTGWKIELHRGGKWITHTRGAGGWYDSGRYVWGGRGAKAISFDAIRVSVFSPDGRTPIQSIHFRGERGFSWIVADLGPIDARIRLPAGPLRAGRPASFAGEPLLGEIKSWRWDFGDGGKAEGRAVTHVFSKPGRRRITLTFSDGKHAAKTLAGVRVAPSVEARMRPLEKPVLVSTPVAFEGGASFGEARSLTWDFGDGGSAAGSRVRHTFAKAGIYEVELRVSDGRCTDKCPAIIRVHTPRTLHVPQVFLDTDQKNEVDDQHYLSYAVFGELDVLGVNSIHHGGGQEPVNYAEILHVLDLARKSGLPPARVPFVFRGADERLRIPESGKWEDTEPVVTDASEAILAAARGASPSNPLWVLPVGPATNTASAILQARAEGLDLAGRMKVMWLGASNHSLTNEFNAGNDPWGAFVMLRGGPETWVVPAPVGGRIRMDVRRESDLYPDNPLGRYLRRIVPRRDKALYDPACLAAVISFRLALGWVKEVEPVTIAGPDRGYRFTKTGGPSTIRVIRRIDQEAMKSDIFNTLKGKPSRLVGVKPRG